MPLPFRAKGVSLAVATNWFFVSRIGYNCFLDFFFGFHNLKTVLYSQNYYVGVTTPILQDTIGWRLYILHAGSCLLSFVVGGY